MKIPFIPLHVVTTKTMESKLAAARDEMKGFRLAQLKKALSKNASGPVRIKGIKRK